jgi:pilus assembly protein Flp/PilA
MRGADSQVASSWDRGRGGQVRSKAEEETSMTQAFVEALLHWVRTNEASEEGQGLAEYGLILALVAVVAIVALTGLGNAIVSTLGQIAGSL